MCYPNFESPGLYSLLPASPACMMIVPVALLVIDNTGTNVQTAGLMSLLMLNHREPGTEVTLIEVPG